MASSSLTGRLTLNLRAHVNDFPRPTLATFSDLPNEILLMIFSEFHTKRHLRKLRFVCRLYNEMVKDLLGERLVISEKPSMVDEMMSGPNIYDKSCRTLVLKCSFVPPDHYMWGMLPKLILKMQGIRTVDLYIYHHIDLDVLETIYSLPAIETLKITFLHHPTATEKLLKIPSQPLSKLKSLSIRLSPHKFSIPAPPIPVAQGPLCYLIANSPALEQLDIGWSVSPEHWRRPDFLNLDALFTYLQRRTNFTSHLRSLKCMALDSLSPITIPFFAQLSRLEIPNDLPEHTNLWPRLGTSGIKLTTIKVQWLSNQLLDYIHNYHGLQVFHMDISTVIGRFAQDQDVQRLLTFALPEHRTTLVDLRFCPSKGQDAERRVSAFQPQSMLWDIPGLFALLKPFTQVERLDLVQYAFFIANETHQAAFKSSLNAIVSHSPKLKTVYMHMVGAENEQIKSEARGTRQLSPAYNMYCFIVSIPEYELSLLPQTRTPDLQLVVEIHPSRELRHAIVSSSSPFTLYAYRVVRGEEKDTCRLRRDMVATEQLNEPVDSWETGYVQF